MIKLLLRRSSLGFTIMEVMIAVAIMGVVSAGVVALIENMNVAQTTQRYGNNELNFLEEIRGTLGSSVACLNSFKGFGTAAAGGNNIVPAGAQKIYDSATPTANLLYQKGSMDIDKTVVIDSMTFTNYGATPGTDNYGTITLQMNYKSTASQGVNNPWRKGQLVLETQVDGGGALIFCVAKSRLSDTLWQIVPGTSDNIYFFRPPPFGNVGIGSTTPTQMLDVGVPLSGPVVAQVTNSSKNSAASASVIVSNGPNYLQSFITVNGDTGLTSTGKQNLTVTALTDTSTMVWSTGKAPTAKMVLLNKGNLGVGLTNPTQTLDVSKNIAVSGQTVVRRDGVSNFLFPDGTGYTDTNIYLGPQNATTGAGDNLIINGGRLKVNTQQLDQNLNQLGGAGWVMAGGWGYGFRHAYGHASISTWIDGAGTVAQLGTDTNSPLQFYVHRPGTLPNVNDFYVPLILRPDGNILMGGAGPFGTSTHVGINELPTGESLAVGGNVHVSGIVTADSDETLKKNITVVPDALEKIRRLRGVTFDWRDPKRGAEKQVGVIAQEVEKVLPEAVRVGENKILSVNYSGLFAPVIEAIKQLYAMIQSLRFDRDAQQREIEELRRDVQYMKSHCAR